MKYIYDSHLGPIFFTDHIVPREQLYCKSCGDFDRLIGEFNTFKECWDILKEECSIMGNGGYCLQYIYPVLAQEFKWEEEIPYLNDYEKLQGFCCLSEGEIISRITSHIEE